jgi:RNA polymerase sigma-70 factor (ECF subfamily)
MAINLALNSMRRNGRIILADMAELEAIPDPMPDPERAALASREMDHAMAALRTPVEASRYLLARWRDEKTNEEIALAFGMHQRSVQKELARTELHLRKVLGRLRRE